MSKPTTDQKTIEALFSDPKTDFLIPNYQRPYHGLRFNAEHYGKILFRLLFRIITVINSKLRMNTFLDRLLLLEMIAESRKSLMGNNG